MKRREAEGKHVSDEQHGRERWLVSYSDFITLLFAFFVVMYAISTLNEGKYRVLSDSLVSAFRHERIVSPAGNVIAPLTPLPHSGPHALPRPADLARVQREQELKGLASKIPDALHPLVQTGQVRLAQTPRGLAVEINASVLFAPAQAMLQPASITALQAVAQVLADADNAVQVEGHTDNVPIGTPQYPSNWELASARASAVVRLFIASGVAAGRLTAISLADNRPVESNDSSDGRARNRRVTLLILADAASGQDGGRASEAMVP